MVNLRTETIKFITSNPAPINDIINTENLLVVSAGLFAIAIPFVFGALSDDDMRIDLSDPTKKDQNLQETTPQDMSKKDKEEFSKFLARRIFISEVLTNNKVVLTYIGLFVIPFFVGWSDSFCVYVFVLILYTISVFGYIYMTLIPALDFIQRKSSFGSKIISHLKQSKPQEAFDVIRYLWLEKDLGNIAAEFFQVSIQKAIEAKEKAPVLSRNILDTLKKGMKNHMVFIHNSGTSVYADMYEKFSDHFSERHTGVQRSAVNLWAELCMNGLLKNMSDHHAAVKEALDAACIKRNKEPKEDRDVSFAGMVVEEFVKQAAEVIKNKEGNYPIIGNFYDIKSEKEDPNTIGFYLLEMVLTKIGGRSNGDDEGLQQLCNTVIGQSISFTALASYIVFRGILQDNYWDNADSAEMVKVFTDRYSRIGLRNPNMGAIRVPAKNSNEYYNEKKEEFKINMQKKTAEYIAKLMNTTTEGVSIYNSLRVKDKEKGRGLGILNKITFHIKENQDERGVFRSRMASAWLEDLRIIKAAYDSLDQAQ